jgi:DNA-binding CsgD family transcriptional regulator
MQERITSHACRRICVPPADPGGAPKDDFDCHGALADAIEAVGFGLILVARSGYVLFANGMARELMHEGEGLRSSSGWLALASTDLTARLRNLLSGVDRAGPGRVAMLLERGGGRAPLIAHIIPLGRPDPLSTPDRERPSAAIFVLDPEHHAAASFEAFSALHGLTEAEGRILREILSGKGLVAAAAKLGVSETTARTHMQRIFEKTGTNRQTELLCAFFRTTLPVKIAGTGV